jgi:uncharacterized glyoxalase superfamily protein PhnB
MELVQSRFVTADVERMARFYANLVGIDVVTNAYYVEVPTEGARVGVAKMQYSDFGPEPCGSPRGVRLGDVILDFVVDKIDAEYQRVDAIGVDWVMPPTMQPWGRRSMMLRDPDRHLINVFSREKEARI